MVAGHKPSSEGDTVGLVVELLGIDLVEVVELAVLEDIRVNSGNAVDGEAVVDIDKP